MSRVRIIWRQGGSVYPGPHAIKQLMKIAQLNYIQIPVGPANWTMAVQLEKTLRKGRMLGTDNQLLVFREPRKADAKRSRYKQALRTIGFTPPGRPPARINRRAPVHPPVKVKASRTVKLLEDEIMAVRAGRDDF